MYKYCLYKESLNKNKKVHKVQFQNNYPNRHKQVVNYAEAFTKNLLEAVTDGALT